MYKTFLITLTFILNITFISAQKRGMNNDPDSQEKGEKPYEMKDRKEAHKPLVTFEDCRKWIIETKDAEADLYRSDDKPLYRDYNGKLVFTPTDRKCEITLKYEHPVDIPGNWDCIDFWNWGFHWLWGEPRWQTALRQFVLVEGADGKQHEIDFTQAGYGGMVHKYWFLNHIKLNGEIKLPAKFIGIRFKGRNAVVGLKETFYLGPVYFYKEELKPLTFEEWPEELPFPLHKTTILPLNKQKEFKNSVRKAGKGYEFIYEDKTGKFVYSVRPGEDLLASVKLKHGNKTIELNKDAKIVFDTEGDVVWSVDDEKLIGDTLFVNATAKVDGQKHSFDVWYTTNQKSLIIGIDEKDKQGAVKEIWLGKTKAGNDDQLVTVPFLTYGSGRVPQILSSGGLFFFKQIDWYYSDASDFIPGRNRINGGWAEYNRGVRYIPMTNGVRNPVHEKIFINVSDDVQEVLPTVDNPTSPMRSMMADRLWVIDGSSDYADIKKRVKELRTLGLEKVAVRYHEGFWRDGGESYTFKTETAPGRGGDEAVKDLVEFIKAQGWLVGLYSNYTDFAPVNANWNPDWVKRGPKGEWEVSWSRCYSPKPMIAVEQERKNAPIIHKKFGTNFSYCDVHTAVSPVTRVDYDYRVPGAGTFRRTYECYGLLLLNETKSYHGPVYSEGNYHWWYAGLVDGNYGNSHPSLDKLPVVFPDFQLLKINPLEMDAGNVLARGAKYLAYTLTYGHIGKFDGDKAEIIRRYAMLQPLQKYYSMIPVKSIRYFDGGEYYNSSEAIQKHLLKEPKLALEYETGFKVFVNFSGDNWHLEAMGESFDLPQYGFLAYDEKDGVLAFYGKSGFTGDKNGVFFADGNYQYYIDANGSEFNSKDFATDGKVFVKHEKFGWEIIPAMDFGYFGFNKEKLGLKRGIQIEGLDINDLPVEQVKFEEKDGKIVFYHQNKDVIKYRISEL